MHFKRATLHTHKESYGTWGSPHCICRRLPCPGQSHREKQDSPAKQGHRRTPPLTSLGRSFAGPERARPLPPPARKKCLPSHACHPSQNKSFQSISERNLFPMRSSPVPWQEFVKRHQIPCIWRTRPLVAPKWHKLGIINCWRARNFPLPKSLP